MSYGSNHAEMTVWVTIPDEPLSPRCLLSVKNDLKWLTEKQYDRVSLCPYQRQR